MTRAPTQKRQVRLQRYIAQSGVAARRKAEDMIVEGRVTVDGKVVRTLGTKIDFEHANVQVDGEAVAPQDHFYILFNKPKGCITAVSDDRGRLTVMDYLRNLPVNVAPVGRLDYYSEGVLLLTNDGDLAARLLGPRSHVAKTYHVKIRGALNPGDIERLRTGVTLDDGTVTLPAEVDHLHGGQSRHDWLVITLHEGKSRQIHRMLEALGHQVTKLQRVSFAGLTFHGLRIGDARELTQQELNDLRELVGLDRTAVARGSWRAEREDTDRARREHLARLAEREAAQIATGTVPGTSPPPGRSAPPPMVDDDGDEDDEGVFERQLAAARGRRGPPSRDAGPGRDRRPRGAAPARADRDDRPRGAAPTRGPRGAASARPDRGPRGAAPTRGPRGAASARPDRGAASGRPDRGPRGAAPTRGPRGAASARPDRGPRGAAPTRGPRGAASARPDRGAASGRPDRGPRGAAPTRGPRGAAPTRGAQRDDRRGPSQRDDRRGPPQRDDRRGPPQRDDRRGPPRPARAASGPGRRTGGKGAPARTGGGRAGGGRRGGKSR